MTELERTNRLQAETSHMMEARSPGQQTFLRLRRHKLAMVSAVLILAWIVIAIFAPLLAPYDPYRTVPSAIRAAPSSEHLLGGDMVGRDLLSRLIYGARTSLMVGLGAVATYVIIGTVLGALSGYFGGLVDAIISRLIDIILCFPLIVVVLTLMSLAGQSLLNIIIVIALLRWPEVARYVRAEFLAWRERDFVTAAEAMGVKPISIVFRHILPNTLSPIVVVATFGVANTIMLEAALSFLGFGVPPPQASWGNILMDAQRITILESMPWLWLPPGLAIAIAVLTINFLGDGLRDALDPHMSNS